MLKMFKWMKNLPKGWRRSDEYQAHCYSIDGKAKCSWNERARQKFQMGDENRKWFTRAVTSSKSAKLHRI